MQGEYTASSPNPQKRTYHLLSCQANKERKGLVTKTSQDFKLRDYYKGRNLGSTYIGLFKTTFNTAYIDKDIFKVAANPALPPPQTGIMTDLESWLCS